MAAATQRRYQPILGINLSSASTYFGHQLTLGINLGAGMKTGGIKLGGDPMGDIKLAPK
jgi:hypothetical protein